MRSLKAIPWSTVAVLAILAGLIALGHNGKITWALVGTVGAYLGLDIMLLHKWRSDPGPKEPTE